MGHAPLQGHSAWQIRLIDKPYIESRFILTHTVLDSASLNNHTITIWCSVPTSFELSAEVQQYSPTSIFCVSLPGPLNACVYPSAVQQPLSCPLMLSLLLCCPSHAACLQYGRSTPAEGNCCPVNTRKDSCDESARALHHHLQKGMPTGRGEENPL